MDQKYVRIFCLIRKLTFKVPLYTILHIKNYLYRVLQTNFMDFMDNLLFNFVCTVHKIMAPKLVVVVFDEFDESDKKSPRVRSVHDQAFQKNSVKESRKIVRVIG